MNEDLVTRQVDKTGQSYLTGQVTNLTSYLISDRQNIDNMNSLIDLNKARKLVSFVGAGVSEPLGIGGWRELMKDLLNYTKRTLKLTVDLPEDLPDDPQEWPVLAEQIYEEHRKANSEEEYFSIISERMRPTKNSTSLTLINLVLILNTHLTTNFDNSIENAYKFLTYLSERFDQPTMRRNFDTRNLPEFGNYDRGNTALIYYLHGNRENDTYIIRKTDYDFYYPSVSGEKATNSSLEKCLEHYYRNSSIVFIGFSFQDNYVRQFFFKLAKDIERENASTRTWFNRQTLQSFQPDTIRHFLVIDSNNSEFKNLKNKIFEKYKEFNIYPIVYKGGQHIFLEKLFQNLAGGQCE